MPDQVLMTPVKVIEKVDENMFTLEQPLDVKVVSITPLLKNDADGTVCHIVLDHKSKFKFVEGQAIGIVNDEKKLTYFTICSSQKGDTGYSNTLSICVKKVCKFTKWFCELKPDAELQITGPVGASCIAPNDPKANVIMIATGTGIALFRSFLNKFFVDKPQKFEG